MGRNNTIHFSLYSYTLSFQTGQEVSSITDRNRLTLNIPLRNLRALGEKEDLKGFKKEQTQRIKDQNGLWTSTAIGEVRR